MDFHTALARSILGPEVLERALKRQRENKENYESHSLYHLQYPYSYSELPQHDKEVLWTALHSLWTREKCICNKNDKSTWALLIRRFDENALLRQFPTPLLDIIMDYLLVDEPIHMGYGVVTQHKDDQRRLVEHGEIFIMPKHGREFQHNDEEGLYGARIIHMMSVAASKQAQSQTLRRIEMHPEIEREFSWLKKSNSKFGDLETRWHYFVTLWRVWDDLYADFWNEVCVMDVYQEPYGHIYSMKECENGKTFYFK